MLSLVRKSSSQLSRQLRRQASFLSCAVLVRERQQERVPSYYLGAALALATAGGCFCDDDDAADEKKRKPGKFRSDLPTVSLETVEAHRSEETGIYAVFDRGVYDLTSFVDAHPGGRKILLAAGTSMAPFWDIFKAHHHPEVYEMLEALRIGNLSEEDAKKATPKTSSSSTGAYASEPLRSPALKANTMEPFNGEPPTSLLSATYLTPREIFFVRNHLPVPLLSDDEAQDENYAIDFALDDHKEFSLTLADLKKKFATRVVTATVQCAGNRRAEMNKAKSVKGLSWGATAIGNATWTGVYLSEVLKYYKVEDDDEKHVQFEGLDEGPDKERYGASVDLTSALDEKKEVLLAFEMNGEPLSRDHGFPLRVIVPGVVGARNVKYLKKITIANEESPSFWQRRDYKGFPPNVDFSTPSALENFAGPSIQELPVTSAILEPSHGAVVPKKNLTIRGYAWAGGGRSIIRVDVSIDGGYTWQQADLLKEDQPRHRAWAWTPWQLDLDLHTVNNETLHLVCKAIDDSYNSQPDTISPIWNMRGLLNNAWHRSTVYVKRDHETIDEQQRRMKGLHD